MNKNSKNRVLIKLSQNLQFLNILSKIWQNLKKRYQEEHQSIFSQLTVSK